MTGQLLEMELVRDLVGGLDSKLLLHLLLLTILQDTTQLVEQTNAGRQLMLLMTQDYLQDA